MNFTIHPVTRRELLDTLRNRFSILALMLYVAGLSGAIYSSWPRSEDQLARSTELARTLFEYFAVAQVLLVSVLAPVVSAGSLTREKEGDTWELLRTSPIPMTGIVHGKLRSALAFLAIVLVASLPIATLLLAIGGIAAAEVGHLYLVLIGLALVEISLGLVISAHTHRTHVAMVLSVLLAFPLTAVLIGVMRSGSFVVLASPAFPYGVLLAGILVGAATVMKVSFDLERASLEPPRPAMEEDVTDQSGLVLDRNRFPDRLFMPEKSGRFIDDSENPVYRKELRSELLGSGTLFVRMVLQVGILLSIFLIQAIVSGQTQALFAYVSLIGLLLMPSLACGAFSQEWERGNADLLMTTLLPPATIVRGKTLALLRYGFLIAGTMVAAHLATFVFCLRGMAAPWTALDLAGAQVIVTGVTIVSTVALSLYFSVVTLRTMTATMLTYASLLGLHLVPLGLSKLLAVTTSLSDGWTLAVTATSALGPLWYAAPAGLCAPGSLWGAYVLLHASLAAWLYVRTGKQLERARS